MKIKDIDVPGFHRVAIAMDEDSGLRAIISVHDITLGPAVGGIRMWKYDSDEAALTDALRLSEGMTYKSAVAETGLGGGKSVIMGDSRKDKTPQLLHAFGRFLDEFGGSYYAAEDVGMSVEDVATIGQVTRWVAGLPLEQGGSGDPSPFTARGTFMGIRACLQEACGSPDLRGRHVVVQGIGHVGHYLVRHLRDAGAEVSITDLNEEKLAAVADETGAKPIAPDAVYTAECDVFAPCALGAILNDETIPALRCRIVAGAANNQLLEDRHGHMLMERGILYAPDFVINAGGIIAVGVGLQPEGWDHALAERRTDNIGDVVAKTLELARHEGIATSEAALMLARQKLEAAKRAQSSDA